MKTKNKLFLILMAVFMMLSLGSCSDKKTTEPDNLKVGDIISFGTHEWRVLDIQSGRALIMSENIFEYRQYHQDFAFITWEDCSLRAYLNEEFFNSNTFSDADRARIVEVTNVNDNNQWFGVNGGANTQDRIFLLSIAEIVKYFGDSGQLDNRPSDAQWIIDQYSLNRIATYNGTISLWWQRSPGMYNVRASIVGDEGDLCIAGYRVDNVGGVRPALWLNQF